VDSEFILRKISVVMTEPTGSLKLNKLIFKSQYKGNDSQLPKLFDMQRRHALGATGLPE
jgi:hypothetical protein